MIPQTQEIIKSPKYEYKTGGDWLRIGTLIGLGMKDAPSLPYHNFQHEFEVWSALRDYAIKLAPELSYEDRFCLETAGLMHDHIVVPGRTDNEAETVKFMRDYLPQLKYTESRIDKSSGLVMATVMPQEPKNFLEQLMCDADLDNLGRVGMNGFFDKGELLKEEWKIKDELEFLNIQLNFISGHEYFTDIAKAHRDQGKAYNIKQLERMIKNYQE